ncbi:MAG: hypothetical protein II680_11510 [Clostridia bacterium]|nr:hypothetical protein [Clostridia bacterium]
MKMRVMYATRKGKMVTYAEAIGAACGCLVNDIPPAYPADKERLVLIGLSMSGDPEDRVRRFCSELTPDKAAYVALFIDGEPGGEGEEQVKEILKTAGTNVLEETYYVKCGRFNFSKKISLEERQHIVDWARKMQNWVISLNGKAPTTKTFEPAPKE